MMGYYWGHSGSFHWLFGLGMVTHIAFLVLVILGIVWLFRAIARPHQQECTALEILKRRYAKSEISSEEYQRMKQEIE